MNAPGATPAGAGGRSLPSAASGGGARGGWRAVGVGLALLLGGCQPRELAERVVTARSPIVFSIWQSRWAADAPPELRRTFEAALQDIRLQIMADREASGSEAVDAALRAKIDGRPVREVWQLGCESRLRRLRPQLAELERVIALNSLLQTRPGDDASEKYLVEVYRKQSARLEELSREIQAAEAELAPLLQRSGRRLLPPEGVPEESAAPGKVRRNPRA